MALLTEMVRLHDQLIIVTKPVFDKKVKLREIYFFFGCGFNLQFVKYLNKNIALL